MLLKLPHKRLDRYVKHKRFILLKPLSFGYLLQMDILARIYGQPGMEILNIFINPPQ